jgi:cob(I)alamin adenosyltransferase
MLKKRDGIIQIYTGDGKGKTTAAFGLAIRALGRGLKVCFIQFIKGNKTGEGSASFLKGAYDFEFASYGTGKFILSKPTEEDFTEAKRAFSHAKESVSSKKYDLVILDELAQAIELGLLKLEDVIDLLKKKPRNVELVITGRDADPKLIELADLVTEMKKIKHPFDKGLKAREGIEF